MRTSENCRVLATKSTSIIDFLPTQRHVEETTFAVIRPSRARFTDFTRTTPSQNLNFVKPLEFIDISSQHSLLHKYKAKSEIICLYFIILYLNKLE